jgi:serine/threonine-protein kinase RsbW
VELEIPSDVSEIERVVELVRRECEAMQFGEHQLRLNVPVALSEAISNAIQKGNCDDPMKRVRIYARVTHLSLIVEVTDEGQGFDLSACTVDPTTPEHIESEDHRGLFLMQKLMDSVETFDGKPGTVVRLTLQRAS